MEWIKGSHNTMSYLKVRQWWLKPFKAWGCCQKRDIQAQWDCGTRYFDFRIKFDKDGSAMFGHGLITYDCEKSAEDILSWIISKSVENENVYIRIILEEKGKEAIFEKWLEKNDLIKKMDDAKVGYWIGTKTPWVTWQKNMGWVGFVEVSKQYDIKWHFIFPPSMWVWEQDRIIQAVKCCNFDGIVAQDFV